MKEAEGKKTVEGDKSCRAIAVRWFMATNRQTGIVFIVHFKRGKLKLKFKNGTIYTISRSAFPRRFIMDLALKSEG